MATWEFRQLIEKDGRATHRTRATSAFVVTKDAVAIAPIILEPRLRVDPAK
jgi:hypothetical protein